MSDRVSAKKPRTDSDGASSPGALGDAIAAVRRAPAPDEVPLAREVSADWGAEREADSIADATSRSYSGPVLDGDRLSTGMQAAMLEASPKLQRLAEVRFDQSDTAASAADSIDALAFTRGNDVAVAKGELTPSLAAHEATHAVQHDDGMVHAKLRGTRAALEQLGGGESTKGLRKKIGAKTNWDKMVEGVGAYESLEDAVMTGGQNPSPQALTVAKPKMLKLLKSVQGDIKSWQKANDQEGANQQSEQWTQNLSKNNERQKTDDRSKAERRQAVSMLSPRVNNEVNLLSAKDGAPWLQSLGLAPDKVGTTGGEKSGQKNSVKELTYQTENGEFSGYFKEEKGFASEMEGHEADVGIQIADPNYGARSVAMYKLDQLFNAGVTARAEFATHVTKDGKSVMGTVLESAKGQTGADTKVALTKQQAKDMGPGTIVISDPVLQRSLNKLQIFDVICGQLDRHDNNYYIQTDGQGNVTGVTGIDLDMAFGGEHTEEKKGKSAPNWKGMPAQVDEEFGEAILRVQAKDIEDALRGLLSPKEIAATVSRFEGVKAKVLQLKQSKSLVSSWNEKSGIREGVSGNDIQFVFGRESYQDNMAFGALLNTKVQVDDLIRQAMGSGNGPSPFKASLYAREIEDLPDALKVAFVEGTAGHKDVLSKFIWDHQLGDQVPEFTMLVLNEMLGDSSAMTKLVIWAQTENFTDKLGGELFQPLSEKWIPAAFAKLPKKKKPGDSDKGGGGGSRRSLLGSSRGKK